MRAPSFLPAPATAVALAPWITSLVVVATLHAAAISAATLLPSQPLNEDIMGAEAVLEIATLVTTADSTESAEQAAREGSDEAQAPEVDERLAKSAEDIPTEQASPRPPEEEDLRMAQEQTQKKTEDVDIAQTTEASPAQPQAMAQEASVASEDSLATADQSEPVAAAPDEGNAKEAQRKVEAWQRKLFSHIAKFKTYPQAARRARATGESLLAFNLSRNGTVSQIRILTSSGSTLLDETAVSVLKRASPMPPLPAELRGESLALTLPMKFSLH